MSETNREEALAHFGVRGMRWGVRNTPSASSMVSKVTAKVKALSTAEVRTIIAVTGVGASVAASMVVGPYGGMAVSGLARAADLGVASKSTDPQDATAPNSNKERGK